MPLLSLLLLCYATLLLRFDKRAGMPYAAARYAKYAAFDIVYSAMPPLRSLVDAFAMLMSLLLLPLRCYAMILLCYATIFAVSDAGALFRCRHFDIACRSTRCRHTPDAIAPPFTRYFFAMLMMPVY